MPENPPPQIFAGVDVGKETLVAATTHGQLQSFDNSPQGITRLVHWLKAFAPERVVLEATGGYERRLYTALGAARLPAVVVQPGQTRSFAKAIGRLEKTDAIDAAMLAEFARAVRTELREVPSEKAIALADLGTRYDQLVDMLIMEKTRLKQAPNAAIKRDVQLHIDFLERQMERVGALIDEAIAQSSKWSADYNILRSVRGVGPVLARKLIASLPELGRVSRQKIAKLVGIAPISRDSGNSSGRRMIYGGRADVRSKLYMAAISSIRYNDNIRAYYRKLRDAGKPAKVAIVACMRKMLTLLNALLRNQQSFQLSPQTP